MPKRPRLGSRSLGSQLAALGPPPRHPVQQTNRPRDRPRTDREFNDNDFIGGGDWDLDSTDES
jgi:hypothetical protein